MTYRYWITQRPYDRFSLPRGYELDQEGITEGEHEAYDYRTRIEDGDTLIEAWGWIEYDTPLPESLRYRYELRQH